jgi:excisionase family DNA binding protein
VFVNLCVNADMDDTILTIKEVAAYLKVNERTVYRLAASRDIPAFKVGGSWRFRKETLEQWIEQQSNQRPGEE